MVLRIADYHHEERGARDQTRFICQLVRIGMQNPVQLVLHLGLC